MVFQDPMGSLDPRQTVESLLLEGMKAHGLAKDAKQAGKRLRELLKAVGLPAGGAEEVPARVLRRPAPAHRHRPGPVGRTRS